jgi:uncharacterized membrane protein YgcG
VAVLEVCAGGGVVNDVWWHCYVLQPLAENQAGNCFFFFASRLRLRLCRMLAVPVFIIITVGVAHAVAMMMSLETIGRGQTSATCNPGCDLMGGARRGGDPPRVIFFSPDRASKRRRKGGGGGRSTRGGGGGGRFFTDSKECGGAFGYAHGCQHAFRPLVP